MTHHPLPNDEKQNFLFVFIVSAPKFLCTRDSKLERSPSLLPKILLVLRNFLSSQMLHFLHVVELAIITSTATREQHFSGDTR